MFILFVFSVSIVYYKLTKKIKDAVILWIFCWIFYITYMYSDLMLIATILWAVLLAMIFPERQDLIRIFIPLISIISSIFAILLTHSAMEYAIYEHEYLFFDSILPPFPEEYLYRRLFVNYLIFVIISAFVIFPVLFRQFSLKLNKHKTLVFVILVIITPIFVLKAIDRYLYPPITNTRDLLQVDFTTLCDFEDFCHEFLRKEYDLWFFDFAKFTFVPSKWFIVYSLVTRDIYLYATARMYFAVFESSKLKVLCIGLASFCTVDFPAYACKKSISLESNIHGNAEVETASFLFRSYYWMLVDLVNFIKIEIRENTTINGFIHYTLELKEIRFKDHSRYPLNAKLCVKLIIENATYWKIKWHIFIGTTERNNYGTISKAFLEFEPQVSIWRTYIWDYYYGIWHVYKPKYCPLVLLYLSDEILYVLISAIIIALFTKSLKDITKYSEELEKRYQRIPI